MWSCGMGICFGVRGVLSMLVVSGWEWEVWVVFRVLVWVAMGVGGGGCRHDHH